MRTRFLFAKTVSIAGAAVALSASAASAQAWHYPTLQVPTISSRDFSVLVAGGGDYGTSFVGQWREGLAPDVMVNFDVGLATRIRHYGGLSRTAQRLARLLCSSNSRRSSRLWTRTISAGRLRWLLPSRRRCNPNRVRKNCVMGAKVLGVTTSACISLRRLTIPRLRVAAPRPGVGLQCGQ